MEKAIIEGRMVAGLRGSLRRLVRQVSAEPRISAGVRRDLLATAKEALRGETEEIAQACVRLARHLPEQPSRPVRRPMSYYGRRLAELGRVLK